MARVTVPGACGYTSVVGVHDHGTREFLRDEMHSAWRHMFDNWRETGHGSEAFPLREGYVGPEVKK